MNYERVLQLLAMVEFKSETGEELSDSNFYHDTAALQEEGHEWVLLPGNDLETPGSYILTIHLSNKRLCLPK